MRVRAASEDDIAFLPEIEQRADTVFDAYPEFAELAEAASVVPDRADQLSNNAVVIVAEHVGALVGFIYGFRLDDCLFIAQISVVPEAQNKGIGTSLLDAFCARAKDLGLRGVTLITFAHISFNAPFYSDRGFVELFGSEMGAALRKEWADDARKWRRFGPRVAMGKLFAR